MTTSKQQQRAQQPGTNFHTLNESEGPVFPFWKITVSLQCHHWHLLRSQRRSWSWRRPNCPCLVPPVYHHRGAGSALAAVAGQSCESYSALLLGKSSSSHLSFFHTNERKVHMHVSFTNKTKPTLDPNSSRCSNN